MDVTPLSKMHMLHDAMTNMTYRPTAYFSIPQYEGLIESNDINTTEDLVQISGVKKNNSVISSSVMFAFGFLGNILALIVLKRSDSEQKRKLFYRLVAGLTLTDLTGTVATSPVVISVYMNDFKWIGGVPMCNYFAFMMIFAGAATMTIVCLMSVERLLCIRHPYLYYARLRKKHATYFLLGAWTFAALVASLPLMGFGNIVLQYPYTWCFFDYYTDDVIHRGFNYLFAILALFMITVTVTCNIVVLFTLFRTKMRGLSRNNSKNSRTFSGYSRRYAEFQMAVLLIGITVVFTSCYAPLMVRIVINQTKLLPVDLRTDLLIIRFASLNQILDPWVYILLRRELVWRVVSTFTSLCSRKSKPDQALHLNIDFRRQSGFTYSSAGFVKDDNSTCCLFCWHCMCDPPQRRQSSTMLSFYSDYGRQSIYSTQSPKSPTNKFAYNIANSVIVPNVTPSPVLDKDSETKRFQYIDELKRQASNDAESVTKQPTKETRVKIYSNGMGRGYKSDPQIYQTLLEGNENNPENYSACL